MPTDGPSREELEAEVDSRNRYEKQRYEYYRTLLFSYSPNNVDEYYNLWYSNNVVHAYREKDITKRRARVDAGIKWWPYIKSRFNASDKKSIDKVIEKERRKQQALIDRLNEDQERWCQKQNNELWDKFNQKKDSLVHGNAVEAQQYFSYVISQDNFSVDLSNRYQIEFSLVYSSKQGRLVIDFRYPAYTEISAIKEWTLSKANMIKEKQLAKKDFLLLYEKIIMDLTLREIGRLYDSDTFQIINEIVFNGYCTYPSMRYPIVLLSVLVKRGELNTNKMNNLDFDSKHVISQFSKVQYLNDISSNNPPRELIEEGIALPVSPIESTLALY